MKQVFREAQNRFLSVIRFLLLPGITAALLLLGLGVWAAVETKFALIPMTKRSQPLPNAHVADGGRIPSRNLSSAGPANSYSTSMQMCPANLAVTNGNTGTWVNTSGATVNIRIAAVGAGGGKNTGTNNGAVNTFFGGSGASIAGDFTVAPGESVFLIAGAPGQNSLNGGSGGGGSGAVNCGNPANCGAGTILLLAGGGGGTSGYASGGGGRATSSTGAGGTNNSRNAAGGGGLNSVGQDGIMVDAMNPNPAFFSTAKGGGQVSKTGISNGGAAGKNNGFLGAAGGNGMGGGGASDGGGYAAGGGGQTGGNGEDDAGGNNGGYSLSGGTNQTNTAGADGGGANQGSVTLTCLGVVSAPNIAVSETGVGNIADGTSFSFGATKVGMSVTKTFTVTNSGSANLTLSNLAVPSGFTFTNFANTTVAPNTSTTFTVTMTAAAAGAPSGSLSFDNNDAGKTPFNFTISGTVYAPPTVSKFFVNPAQGNSNNTSLNGTARLAIAITNPPGNPGSLSGLAITDNFPAGLEVDSPVVSSNTCGGTFAPIAGATSFSFSGGGPLTVGNQCTIFVVVKATTAGAIVNTTGNVSSTEGGTGLTASGTLNVFAPPTISKAYSPGSIFVGGTFSQLTFTIANPNTSGTLTGVGFSDALPSGLEVASTPGLVVTSCGGSTNTSSFTTGATTLNVSNAAVTAGTNCTIRVNVIGTTAGAKNNTTGPITSTEGGTGTTSNTATLNVFTAPQITKSFGASTIPVGGTTTLTFTITNPAANPGALSTITFIDSLPPGMLVVNPPVPTNTCSGSVTAVDGSGTISLGGASIATPGNSCQVQATVIVASEGVKNNSVQVSSGNGGTGNTATASVTVANPPTVAKAFSPSLITPNGTSTLTITLSNPNAGVALTGASVTDTLPFGVTTVNSTAATTCGGTASQTSGTVSLSGGTIPASGSCTLTVNVTSAANNVYTNTIAAGALTTADSGPNATPATATLVVGSAPAITKSFTPNAIKTGATSTMTIAITNNNASLPFNGVDYTDTLPAGLTVPDAAAAPACGGTLTVASNVITLTGATIAAGGGTCTATFTVTGATVGVKNNTVTVNTANFGMGYTGTGTITVYDVPTITKGFSPTSVPFGGTSTMSFVLTNPNSFSGGNLSGLGFSDTLPPGITVSSGTTSVCGGTLTTTAPSTVLFSGGTLGTSGPGNTCMINVAVAGTQLGMHTNTVSTLTSTETGTNTVNASATLTVTASPTTTTIANAATLASTPTVVGQFYAVNVTVAPAMGGMGMPTGTVNVSDGTGATCTITLSSGSGTCNLTSTTAGAKTISASYQGDTNFATSSTTATHTVNKANTTLSNLTDSPDPSVVGQPYTVGFTLSVNSPGAGTPTGTVIVNDGTGGTCTATLPTTSCQLTSTTAGVKTITLTYNGDANFNTSTATAGHAVNKADTTVAITNDTPDPSVIGQNYAVTAGVAVNSPGSGTPTGTITVTDGTNNCTITLPGTSCNLPSTSVGVKTLTATYSGDANYNGSGPSPGVSHAVNKADAVTTITSDNPDPSAVGQNVTVAFTVAAAAPGAGTPTGNVTITISGGSETCTGSLAAGSGSCTLALTTAGSRLLTATYNGDANFNASTDTEPHTVVAPPAISKAFSPATVPVGQTSTLTFTITNPAANTLALTGVGFTDTFPNAPNLIVANPTGATLTGCGGATLTDNLGGALAPGDLGVRLSGATVGVGGTCTVTVNIIPQAQGPFVNITGNVSSTNGGTGNTATATLTTNTPPTITPVAISRAAGSTGSNSTIATVSDNETAAGSLIVTITSANPSNGVTLSNLLNTNGTITANAVAACGATNASFTLQVSDGSLTTTGTLNVTVTPDNIPPTIGACPANITANTATNSCAATVTFTAPTASDNCAGATVTCVPASGSSFAKGVTTVTCTARDAANNTGSSCSFTVTVVDNQNPTIACAANQGVTSTVPVVVNYPAPTVSDNCAGVTSSCTPAAGSTFPLGVTTVTCTATDAANRTASCSFTVSVNNTPVGSPVTVNTPPVTVTFDNVTSGGVTTVTPIVPVPATPPPPNGYFIQNTNFAYDVSTTAGYNGAVTVCFTVPDSLLGTVKFGNLRILHLENGVWVDRTILPPNTPAPNLATRTLCARTTTLSPFVLAWLVESPGPGLLASPNSEMSDQKAGSILVYNIYTSGTTSANTQNTRINLTNTNPQQTINVHLFFVAEGCSIADSYVCLTANQTTSFLASDLDPGTTGYLVAIAVDDRGCPTFFNYLIGDEYVKFTSGHAANLAAEAFAALDGGLPACDGNSVTAQLNFDGTSYNRLPAALALSNVGSRADGNDTLLIVNRIGGNLGTGAATLGTLFGIMYDDAENALSFSVAGNCQLRNSITNNFPRTTPRFESFIPAGRTGWLKIYNQTGAIGITGAAINFNPNASSSAGAFNQGHNLHHLTLNATSSYIIPVFPPSC